MSAGGASVTQVTIQAPVKLNLYLHVVGRKGDGYHEVDTLIAFTDFGDAITVEQADHFEIVADGPYASELPDKEGNLIIHAVRALRDASGFVGGAKITLTKNIPVAAGIGGGSADAAAALLAVSRLYDLDTKNKVDLFEIGRGLGADVPSCLFRRPCFASGVGHDLMAAPVLPEAGIVLVNPGIKLATASVFKARKGGFTPDASNIEANLEKVPLLVSFLKNRGNDLTDAAVKLCPAVEDVLYALEQVPGCRMARMSGSGATCFGVFDDRAAADAAVEALEAPDHWWVQAMTMTMPERI